MKRRDFVSTSILGMIGTSLPLFSMMQSQVKFSKNDLMGRGTPLLFGNDCKLRKQAYQAFIKMKTAALQDGFKIKTVSSYRNYNHQNRIWERKYNKFTKEKMPPLQAIQKIVEYSTIPGTSRHHWGTDIDIVDGNVPQPKGLLLAKNFEGEGPFCRFKEWMDQNANTFGFYLVYTDEENRKGFKYEPWHYSYAPLSIPMLKAYRELDIKKEVFETRLKGSKHFTTNFINRYITENILDINPQLL